MKMWLAALALLAVPVAPAAAQAPDIVVKGDAARREIERILRDDNLDTSRLDAREVADSIGGIGRGRAPDDFWLAYRAHVAAWRRLADAEEAARRSSSASAAAELEKAERAIDSTFDEVERIARRYGARLPTPPWSIPPTV
ncbi:MAG TPA: hypothetical protein VF759_12030 [Allosphingosinicella sp.]|jgi:hypothetical protein